MEWSHRAWWKYRLWLAGAGGLMLGVVCQKIGKDFAASSFAEEVSASHDNRGKKAYPKNTARLHSGRNTALLAKAATAGPAECESLAMEILSTETSGGRAAELETILLRWMTFEDPQKLMEKLDALTKGDIWKYRTGVFFNAWAATNYTQAMDASSKMTRFGYERAVAAVEHEDPAFLDCLAKADPPLSGNENLDHSLTRLARDHPELARNVADLELPADRKSEILSAVASGWASTDPAAALTWINSLNGDSTQTAKLASIVFGRWANHDLEAARKAFADSSLPETTLSEVNDQPTDSLLALKNPTSGVAQLRLAVARDPFLDVASLYRHLAAGEMDWKKSEFNRPAIDWEGWYCADPASAAKQAEQLPPGKARDFILKNIAEQWAARDADAAREFAGRYGIESSFLRELPSAELRAAAVSDPRGTLEEIFSPDLKRDTLRFEHLKKLGEEWAEMDPKAASQWVTVRTALTENGYELASDHLLFSNTLGYHWAKNDAVGAIEWMESLEPGQKKTEVWKAMRHYTTTYSPDLSFEISAKVLDDGSRMPLLESSLREINQSFGEPVALAHLDSPDLSDDERTALRKYLRDQTTAPAPAR